MKPDISICILTWNRAGFLDICLREMFAAFTPTEQGGLKREILIMDNASTDNTPEVLAKYADYPGVKIIRNKKNLRFAAYKRLFFKAKGRIIIDLDDDGSTSYHFNTHADIWGWATWRRVWRHYDVDMKPYLKDWEEVVSKRLPTKRGRHDFICGVNAVINGLQTWDYQFGLMFMARGYLAAVPKGKLVTNRGVNEERGSNTQGYMFDLHHIAQLGSIVFPLVHPAEVAADINALNLEERRQFGIIPRVITWFGCKVPCLGGTLDAIGRCLERVVPSMFRI